jgi:hypothetical protein
VKSQVALNLLQMPCPTVRSRSVGVQRPGSDLELIGHEGNGRRRSGGQSWGLSSNWTENRVKPGRGSHFFLQYRIFPPSTYLQPILAQRPIWRDVPLERLFFSLVFVAQPLA